jgi:nicotinate-nucleotide pyrophosphorylase (carboxylating)
MWTDILDRQKVVEIAYQKGTELNLNNKNYLRWIDSFFTKEYNDDVGAGDITSKAILTKNEPKTALLKAKAAGVIGGIEEVTWFLRMHNLNIKVYKKDGANALRGETILEIQGYQKTILAIERIALNVMQRMSGIATETKCLVDMVKEYNTWISATRKTVLKYIDKKAVFLGGGLTHRFGLWDSILIKDNHLEALKSQRIANYIETALAKTSAYSSKVGFIEIEVTSYEEALRAARKFKTLMLKVPCVIMLDNMVPETIEATLERLRKEALYDSVLFEASGDITPENILAYAKTGIDIVSLGYLTHSARALDMSLEMTA